MITLTLLHPVHLTPVQHWTFQDETMIVRLGRSTDNHVVLYSAVVSRHHLDIRWAGNQWILICLGANGTYVDGQLITEMPIQTGMVIQLAPSGPSLQIHLNQATPSPESSLSTAAPPVAAIDAQLITEVPLTPTVPDDTNLAPIDSAFAPSEPIGPRATTLEVFCTVSESKYLATVPSASAGSRSYPVLEPYQITRLLGQGSMGITYLGWHRDRSEQPVVLKTLNAEWVKHPQAVTLFEQQAKALSHLDHPGLAAWQDVFMIEGKPYLVIDEVAGQSLFQWVIKRGKVEASTAIGWMLELCDILEYLHHRTPIVLHQEIRPENLIRRQSPIGDRELVLVDFGGLRTLGRILDPKLGLSGYLAPEQKHTQATAQSDLYAIGAMGIFLMSAQEPSLFYRYSGAQSRLCADLVPEIPSELVPIIDQLTHPRPTDRYGSAQEAAAALKQLT